ncbi:MAG: helix-turn-helix domain-containing protein [Myxococcota bacterium]
MSNQNTSISSNTVWLTTTEAGARMGLSRSSVLKLINDGMLPAYRPTQYYRIKESDLEAYLQSVKSGTPQ